MEENSGVNIRNHGRFLQLNYAIISFSLSLTFLRQKQTLQRFSQLIVLVLLKNDRCNQNKGNSRRAPPQHL